MRCKIYQVSKTFVCLKPNKVLTMFSIFCKNACTFVYPLQKCIIKTYSWENSNLFNAWEKFQVLFMKCYFFCVLSCLRKHFVEHHDIYLRWRTRRLRDCSWNKIEWNFQKQAKFKKKKSRIKLRVSLKNHQH